MVVSYKSLAQNSLSKRKKVLSSMQKLDSNFNIGNRKYDAKRSEGKEEQLKRMKEKEYALHY